MKIIIAGAGEVGFHLAKLLSYESQEITLIDNKKDALVYAGEHLDIKTIQGDATSIAILRDARVEASELFISCYLFRNNQYHSFCISKAIRSKAHYCQNIKYGIFRQ